MFSFTIHTVSKFRNLKQKPFSIFDQMVKSMCAQSLDINVQIIILLCIMYVACCYTTHEPLSKTLISIGTMQPNDWRRKLLADSNRSIIICEMDEHIEFHIR